MLNGPCTSVLCRVLSNSSGIVGRQLFERNRDLEAEDNLVEEGAVSVDFSQYERETVQEEEEQDRVTFSDSE